MNPYCVLQMFPYLKTTIAIVLKIYIQLLMVIIILYTKFRKKCIMRKLSTKWSRLDFSPRLIWFGTGGTRGRFILNRVKFSPENLMFIRSTVFKIFHFSHNKHYVGARIHKYLFRIRSLDMRLCLLGRWCR